MSQYYYTIANLPFLLFSQKPLLSREAFAEICRIELSREDFTLLMTADYACPEKAAVHIPVVRRWLAWETSLRNTLVRFRAKKKSLPPEKYLHPAEDELDAINAGQAACEEESPVKAEELLDRARWRFLEELEVSHYFDLAKLIIYFLKLQILEKRFAMQADRGKERYKTMIDTFYDSIKNQEQVYG